MELAIYCLSRAIESFGLCLVSWGYVRPNLLPKRMDVLMFSAATAAIMHCYSGSHGKHRDVFRSKYLNVLDFILGSTGMEHGSIQHVPSTADLLSQLESKIPAANTVALRRRTSSLLRRLSSLENLQGLGRDHDDDQPAARNSIGSEPGITKFRHIHSTQSLEGRDSIIYEDGHEHN
jgi:hypothetical protein